MSSPPVNLPLSEAARGAARLRTASMTEALRRTASGSILTIPPPSTQPEAWSPSSWQTKPIKQDVQYPDREAFEKTLAKLESLPMIVHPKEIYQLRKSLEQVALGKAFLLQGGDCAELFDYCTEEKINGKIATILQMSLVLVWGLRLPIVRIGRIAGQFAKPRSKPTEIVNGEEIPSFRGDNINGFDPSERTPDPSRLVQAYFHSATTLNYIRAQLNSGYADLNHPFNWSLTHVQDSDVKAKYLKTVSSLTDSLSFMRTIGAENVAALQKVDFYTSHEALLLEYEQSFTRKWRPSGDTTAPEKWFNTSAHFIWIGDRTRQLDGAHVEYFRGVENPIGIKVGPSMKPEEIGRLLDIVNPNREVGKVTLITRYGCDKVDQILPSHIEAVKKTGHTVIWQCDPMHGNTRSAKDQPELKTRQFSSIMSEITSALKIHKQAGTWLGGIHLELTGDAVTECVGGSEGLTDEDLSLNYQTYCDPRLNGKQALDVAFAIADHYHDEHAKNGSL